MILLAEFARVNVEDSAIVEKSPSQSGEKALLSNRKQRWRGRSQVWRDECHIRRCSRVEAALQ